MSHPPIRGLAAQAAESARRACAAHSEFVTALYGGTRIDCGEHLTVLFNPFVGDPEWNLGIGLHQPGVDRNRALERFRTELESRGRRLAVLLDSRHPEDIEHFPSDSWEVAFRFAGLIYPPSRPTPEAAFPGSAQVQDSGTASASVGEIADVFETAFGTTVSGGLDPGYPAALRAGLARSGESDSHPEAARLFTTLVRCGGEAAAIGTRVQQGAVAGLYNLGVVPSFQRRGLGGAITRFRVAQARGAGAQVIYLLTEDPRVEASQIRRGFVPAFELVGLAEKRPPG